MMNFPAYIPPKSFQQLQKAVQQSPQQLHHALNIRGVSYQTNSIYEFMSSPPAPVAFVPMYHTATFFPPLPPEPDYAESLSDLSVGQGIPLLLAFIGVYALQKMCRIKKMQVISEVAVLTFTLLT